MSLEGELCLDTPIEKTPSTSLIMVVGKNSRCRVLVVEDEPLSAQIAARFLSNLACTVDIAANAQCALEAFEENTYDLIFMDIGLPDMDGYLLVKKIQETEKFLTRPVPIVALTAHGDEESKRQCLAKGMSAALVKPLLKTTTQEILSAFIPQWTHEAAINETGEYDEVASLNLNGIEGVAIDFELALNLHEQDVDFVKMALGTIINSFSSDLNQIDSACRAKKWSTVGLIIHRLQGVTRYFGLNRLGQVCAEIAKALEKHPSTIYKKAYLLLSREMQEVKHCYDQWLQDQ